jgi:hypothetical protein
MASFGFPDREPACANCRHYRQHYTKETDGYCRTDAGHCVYLLRRPRPPGYSCRSYQRVEERILKAR